MSQGNSNNEKKGNKGFLKIVLFIVFLAAGALFGYFLRGRDVEKGEDDVIVDTDVTVVENASEPGVADVQEEITIPFVDSIAERIKFIEDAEGCDDEVASAIRTMFDEVLYEDDDYLREQCTAKLVKKLQDAYDYDYDESKEPPCASWLFRSQCQDSRTGDESIDKREVIKVVKVGNDYCYYANDMGWKFINIISVADDGKFDDLQTYVSGYDFIY